MQSEPTTAPTPRLGILLSGRGSNFLAIHEAIVEGGLPAAIVAVISNQPLAAGIRRAETLGYSCWTISHRDFPSRDAHEEKVAAVLEAQRVDYVVLAGYMRLLSSRLIGGFRNRILNIHPSLLPAFPGVDAQRQAWEHGVRVSGCTVHLVDEGLDQGPIIVQSCVPVEEGDSPESLAERILVEEHRAYPEAIRQICTRHWKIEGRRVVFP
ncbi:MAG TPA: phosphoribosylglycinamide formyltransferase [Thermoanaerobaculia bacterium]|nr:phosphoribosylglycinamide formyltransferase [Thermoanaerobaculia bacterium]